MKEGPISQWDSTTTNPPHWSGDMYQEQLNRPTTHWCQPLPLSPPSPPLFSLPVLYCKLRQQTRGQWGQELPLPFTAITHYVPLEPATNNPSEINTAKPDPHMYTASKGAPAATQPEGSMWPPLNASGEGSPHTANGVSNPMQQFQGTCTCTHMYQWNHTCPPSNTTNGTSGTFSPHSKWTYYLDVPTTLPPPTPQYLSFTEGGANGTIPTQYNYQPSS